MKTFLLIVGVLALIFGVMCFETWLIMLLWNWLVPILFNGVTLTFWQTFGVTILIDLLFGGISVKVKG
jgi:hypothetical protein